LLKAEFEAKQRKKVKRNEPCPCGSGKKFKDCCGKSPKF
jgi:preprotein translocase subunit SecA